VQKESATNRKLLGAGQGQLTLLMSFPSRLPRVSSPEYLAYAIQAGDDLDPTDRWSHDGSVDTVENMLDFGISHTQEGDFAGAEKRFRIALSVFKRAYGPLNNRSLKVAEMLISAYSRQEKWEECENILGRLAEAYWELGSGGQGQGKAVGAGWAADPLNHTRFRWPWTEFPSTIDTRHQSVQRQFLSGTWRLTVQVVFAPSTSRTCSPRLAFPPTIDTRPCPYSANSTAALGYTLGGAAPSGEMRQIDFLAWGPLCTGVDAVAELPNVNRY